MSTHCRGRAGWCTGFLPPECCVWSRVDVTNNHLHRGAHLAVVARRKSNNDRDEQCKYNALSAPHDDVDGVTELHEARIVWVQTFGDYQTSGWFNMSTCATWKWRRSSALPFSLLLCTARDRQQPGTN